MIFRHWTYEINYKREVVRLCLLLSTFIIILFFRIYCFYNYNEPVAFKIILLFVLLQFPYYVLFSIARLSQIKQNYSNSFEVDDKSLNVIRKTFPNKTIYLYSKKKYISLSKNKVAPLGKFLLIRIGREKLNKEKIIEEARKSNKDFEL